MLCISFHRQDTDTTHDTTMKRCILVNAAMLVTISLTLGASSLVSGFAPPTQYQTTTTATACFHRHMLMDRSHINLSLASQDNDSIENDSNSNDEEVVDEYDFQAGFQKRVKKEGGVSGIKAKAAKRSVDSVTRNVTGSIKSKLFSEGLVSTSEWGLTVGFLALVVVLAISTQFGSSPVPFETDTNGDELFFGAR